MSSRSSVQSVPVPSRTGQVKDRGWVVVWMLVVVLSPLAVGGAAAGARVVLAGLVLLLGAAFLMWSAWRNRPVLVPLSSGVMVLAGLWTLAQTWLAAGVAGSSLHAQVSLYLGEPARMSITPAYAPAGALIWFALATAMVLSATLFSVPGRLTRAWMAVAGAGWVALVVGLVHHGMGLDFLYGLSAPDLALVQPRTAPFINGNQMGSLLAMSVVAGFMLARSSSSRWMRPAGAATVVGLLPAVVWMQAGSAAAGLAACALIGGLSWLVYRQIGVRAAIRAFWALTTAVSVVGALVAWMISAMGILPAVLHPSLLKANLWHQALLRILDSPWWGTGYGSSGDVLAGLATTRFEVYFTMVESQPLQLAMDLGIPVALLVMASFAYPLVRGTISDSGRSSQRRRLLLLIPLPLIVVDSILGVGLSALSVALGAGVLAGSPTGFALRSRGQVTSSRSAWLWAVVTLVLLVGAWLVPQVGRSVELARRPWPNEWIESAQPPTTEEVRARAAIQPALLTIWFVDALVSERSGDEARATMIRRLMTERAPDAMLTRRLRLSHALESGDDETACEDLRQLALAHRSGLDTSVLEPDVTRWHGCVPDEEAEQQWWFDQLGRSTSSSQVLATALLALRESQVPWVAARAAATSSHELGFEDEARHFAVQHGRLAPRSVRHIREALDLAAVTGEAGGAWELVQRSEGTPELSEVLALARVVLEADAWWHGDRDAEAGAAMKRQLEDLRNIYLFNDSYESLYLSTRAMIAHGSGETAAAASLANRALSIDPRDRRAAAVRAALRRGGEPQTD